MLERLKTTLYWKNYIGDEESYDDEGNYLGDIPRYSDEFSARMNISPNKGTADNELFGNLLDYDRTIATKDTAISITENSILWLDGAKPPAPHNYVVLRKAVSNNIAVFAIKRVEVSD